ncbi:MAG: cell envelope integrity protein TolA [Deltaproteobacteria bacterium]|nr:cell envelope integrity protein TolA [Deltaproteobacteria bacterium]
MTDTLSQRFLYVPLPALFFSIALHVSIAVVLIIFHVSGFFAYKMPDAKKSLYQDFIQVDVVALPDELPNQRPALDMSQPVVDTPAPMKDIRVPVEPQEMLLPREKTMSTQEKLKKRQADQDKALKELEAEARREQAMKNLALNKGQNEGRAQLKGNIMAQGNARTGELGTAKDLYDAKVRAAIKEHFNVYPWQKKKALLTIVHIELFPTGRVRSKKVLASSQDHLYDAAVLQAIDQAQPLPVPADLSLIKNGITVEFKPAE